MVAFDVESNQFGCQQCIFENDGFDESEFITLKARDIHDQFKKNYEDFQDIKYLLTTIRPELVTQSIRARVHRHFANLKAQLDNVETEVMSQIKNSDTLQKFLETSENLLEDVNEDMIGYIEQENQTISDKICQSRFAYLVIKHKHYQKLNQRFESLNDRTRDQIQEIKDLESRIIEFKNDQDEIITSSFRDLIQKTIRIDGTKPTIVETNVDNPEENKEGLISEDSKLAFLMKEDRVYSLDLFSKKLIEIEKLNETFLAKLLPISNKSLLVVGGQTT